MAKNSFQKVWNKLKPKNGFDSNRRKIFLGAGVIVSVLVIGASLLGTSLREQAAALVVGIWSEYIDESIYREYTAKTGVPIRVVNYDSNEALEQRLRGTTIDLFVPSDYFIGNLVDQNYLEELDLNALGINPQRDYIPTVYNRVTDKDIFKYSIPYFWGYNALAFKDQATYDRIAQLVGGEENIKNMSFFYNEAVLAEFELGIVDDRSFLIPIGLSKIGKDYIVSPDANTEVEEARQALASIRPYISRWRLLTDAAADDQFRNEGIDVAFTYSGWANCFFSCDETDPDNVHRTKIVQLNNTILWVDGMAVNAFSRRKKAANDFLKFVFEKQNQLKNMRAIGDFSMRQDAYNEAVAEGSISSKVSILQDLDVNGDRYHTIPTRNFQAIKSVYDTFRS